jgi:hypothetical protein
MLMSKYKWAYLAKMHPKDRAKILAECAKAAEKDYAEDSELVINDRCEFVEQ